MGAVWFLKLNWQGTGSGMCLWGGVVRQSLREGGRGFDGMMGGGLAAAGMVFDVFPGPCDSLS